MEEPGEEYKDESDRVSGDARNGNESDLVGDDFYNQQINRGASIGDRKGKGNKNH
jgi:hypothetical protein